MSHVFRATLHLCMVIVRHLKYVRVRYGYTRRYRNRLLEIYTAINFTRYSVTEVGALSAAGWAWSARGRHTLPTVACRPRVDNVVDTRYGGKCVWLAGRGRCTASIPAWLAGRTDCECSS